jgi:hypothetical protein
MICPLGGMPLNHAMHTDSAIALSEIPKATGAEPMMATVRPLMRALRALLKSQSDDIIVAPGKRSAARGNVAQILFLFSSGLARGRRAKPEEKRMRGLDVYPGPQPRRLCPGLQLCRPLRGSGKANQALEPTAAVRPVCGGIGEIDVP